MSNPNNSENNNQDLNPKAVPFFARYLEGQSVEDLSEDEMEAIGGSLSIVTYKYPSDNEDGGCGVVTKKYPSDTDEVAVTLKYPSDKEDGGGGGFVTLKYPSDNDE